MSPFAKATSHVCIADQITMDSPTSTHESISLSCLNSNDEENEEALRRQNMTAVCVRNACKQYGSGSDSHAVLQGLDMTVEKGVIYGLLGASGCGKTTLLTCIVGRRRLGSGDIWVLGGKPGSKGSGVPGPRLGYMPQELSLMREFTTRDALQHFAWIYGMSNKNFEERYQFLAALLDLPEPTTKVKNLSGGQQRRASLAVALINDPELLILDEPTVGLDPVLRQRIWDYLVNAANQGKTIIITTHYIEEAKQAHKIGLMRNGRLLAEGSPQELLVQFNASSIEQVFLQLSEKQELGAKANTQKTEEMKSQSIVEGSPRAEYQKENGEGRENGASCRVKCNEDDSSNDPKKPPGRRKFGDFIRSVTFKKKGHAKALLSKNFYRTTRNPGAILFIFLFPMLEICAFFLAVGGWPKGMKLGIVNEELVESQNCGELRSALGPRYGGSPNISQHGLAYCSMRGLSCKFIELLNDSVAEKVYFDDFESGMKAARDGHLIGLLHFSRNFSESFEARLDMGSDSSNGTIDSSELPVFMDMSLRQSALLVEQKLRDTHRAFMKSLFKECDILEKVGTIPLHFQEPVHGNYEINFSVFMAPGVVITMIFFISVGVTAMIIVVERLDGIWDRTLCAGITSQEILLSHAIIEAFIVLIQSAEVFIFVFYVFQIPCLGSYLHVMVLLFLQGFTGMCGGFLVSVSCNSITASNYVTMGSFYPVLILSGLLWPVEGMPVVLRAVALAMPTTLATSSMRNIMEKGWGMFDNHVYQGYLVSIAWIFGFSLLSLIVIKLRK